MVLWLVLLLVLVLLFLLVLVLLVLLVLVGLLEKDTFGERAPQKNKSSL